MVGHTSRLKGQDPTKWGFFDKLSFSWMYRVVPAARKGTLTVDDLPLPDAQQAEPAYNELRTNWENAVAASGKDGKQPKLLKVLLKTYGRDLLLAGIFKLMWSVFVILGAYFFTRSILLCIRTLEGKDTSPFDTEWKGWVLTGFFFIDAWLLGIALQRMAFGCLSVGIRARAALVTMISRKCYGMAHLTTDTAAEAVSFVANDINKIFEGIQEVHYLWGAPIEAAAILALLATLVGIYALPGVGIVCAVVPLQYFFGLRIIRNKVCNSPNTNERYSIVQELLPSMKLVKYYAWERFFEQHISDVRAREKKLMFRNAVIKTINITMVFGVPPCVLFAVLVPYELAKYDGQNTVYIKPQTAFTMLSLFNVLRFPLVVLPKALRCVSEALNASANLEKFLAAPAAPKQDSEGAPGGEMHKAVLTHALDTSGFQLRVPNFSVQRGELVAVVGRVGAGKSSLLHALLGNMDIQEGTCHSGGKISYVPQVAWCQNLSLKENIVFGQAFDNDRYQNVIHACALELDLQILQDGDQSKAGLRGINLSGGQRQRLNLARAAYFDGDLVLLDNALSAVDHHTAQHIFQHCVRGIFRDKACVLVTHQVEFLPQCDKVCIMDDGNCMYFGPWNAEAAELLSRYLPTSHLLAAAGNAEQPKEGKPVPKKATKEESKPDEKKAKERSASLTLTGAMWEYGCDAGWILFFFSLFFFLTAQASRQLADYFIRWWTRDEYNKYGTKCGPDNEPCGPIFYVQYYGILGVMAFLVLMVFRGAALYAWAMKASQRMHEKSVHRMLYAPLGFFLTTPVGDLLVSFTKDQDTLDEALPDALYYAGIYGLILCATTITVSVTIPLFSALAGSLFLVSGIMLSVYLPAATHLKKLRMGTAGDLVTLVAESLDGLGVIQAFNKQAYFTQVTSEHVDAAHRALFGAECLNLWLAFICDFFGAALVLSVGSFGISGWRTLGSSNVGLAFSQSIQMLVFYTWSIRLLADSIGMFGAAEKMSWLANHTPQEAGRLAPPTLPGQSGAGKRDPKKSTAGVRLSSADSAEHEKALAEAPKVPAGWPRSGAICFDQVVMKYAPHLPPALRGVSFKIKSGEKVGVVGRTGSGKSTLLLALYRMFNLESGSIIVDGIDVSTLTLEQLRRGLSVIPQEPVVFSGTVRTNLDPFGEYGADALLWEAIRDVGLEEQCKACGGLDSKLDGTSAAWSLGQQQLMCLARAALKKVPVLCLDEATAAMDPHTEAYVLEIIERLFSDRTTFTIAHRLDTVIRSDQVIVMDAGVVAEIAPPSVLLANPNSSFSRLVDKTGAASAAAMRKMAADFAEERVRGQQIGFKKRPSLDETRRSLEGGATGLTLQ
uniref:HLA3 protein n=1 Tax=Chlorella sp. ArM0029B TaxID=1415603 RepID=A0A345AXC2_9CHLO|nr:HLA3 protein [Chlorella sp. ArM0029B]